MIPKRLQFMDRWAPFRGYEPHEGQLRLHADRHRHRTLRKGRRGGGTTAGSFEVEVEAQLWGGEEGYADIGLFAPTTKKTEILYGMVHDSLITQRRFSVSQVKRSLFAPGNRRIETTWGSRIVAFSLEEESPGEGWGFRLVVVDESQLISLETWNSSIRPTLSDKGGRCLFIGKAAGPGFRALCRNAVRFPRIWAEHSFPSRMNPVNTAEELEEARAELPDWLYGQEYEAEFQDFGDAVFSPSAVEALIDDDLPLPGDDGAVLPYTPGHVFIDGWDLAKKVDRTVGITLDSSEQPYPLAAYWRGFREPWPRIQQRMEARQKAYQSHVWIDSTGLGDVVLDNLGIPTGRLEGYVFSPKSKLPLLTNLQKMVDDRAIRIPRIPQLIRELEDYRWDDSELETDCVMGLALAAWGVKQRRSPRLRTFDLGDLGMLE
jgi:hypothetical protein